MNERKIFGIWWNDLMVGGAPHFDRRLAETAQEAVDTFREHHGADTIEIIQVNEEVKTTEWK